MFCKFTEIRGSNGEHTWLILISQGRKIGQRRYKEDIFKEKDTQISTYLNPVCAPMGDLDRRTRRRSAPPSTRHEMREYNGECCSSLQSTSTDLLRWIEAVLVAPGGPTPFADTLWLFFFNSSLVCIKN